MKIKLPLFPADGRTYYVLTDTSSVDHQPYVGMKLLPDRAIEEGAFVEFSARGRDSAFPLFIKELIVRENPETIEVRNMKGLFMFRRSAI